MLCEMRLWGGGSWESRKKSRPSGPWGSSGSRAGKQRLSRAEVCAEIVAGKLPQTLHANGVMVARGWPLGPLPEDLQDTIEIPARVDRNRRGSSVRWKAGGHARGLVVVRIGCTGRSVQINAEHNPRSFRSLPRKERGTGGGIRTPDLLVLSQAPLPELGHTGDCRARVAQTAGPWIGSVTVWPGNVAGGDWAGYRPADCRWSCVQGQEFEAPSSLLAPPWNDDVLLNRSIA